MGRKLDLYQRSRMRDACNPKTVFLPIVKLNPLLYIHDANSRKPVLARRFSPFGEYALQLLHIHSNPVISNVHNQIATAQQSTDMDMPFFFCGAIP